MGADSTTRSSQEGGDPLELLAADDVRSRAASGAALLGARGVLIYTLGIGANLLLARLLVPKDFGVVTLGTVMVVVGATLAEGGFGAALIRRDTSPARSELEAFFGLQLCVAVTLAVAFAAGAAPFGRDGLVLATMVASLPITVLRMPSVIVLERQLQYRVIATVDVVDALSYYLWAIGAVLLGLGVWGLATAVVFRAIAGTTTILAIGPLGLVRPRWSWVDVRPLIRFGVKFQATNSLVVARDQGLNVAIAAVAGLATLGVWNLAWRVLQIPNLVFITVARVAFPAMARLLDADQDVRPFMERGAAALSVLTGIVVVGLVAFAPALPTLVGQDWHAVPAVLLWSGIALIVSTPITVATSGYLFAADQVGAVATAILTGAVTWFAVALALLPRVGAPAVGVGWLAAALVGSGMLWRRTAARTGAALAGHLAGPTAISLGAAISSWVLVRQLDEKVLGGVLGLVTGELILIGGLALVSRRALLDTRSLVGQGLQSLGRLRAPHTASAPEPAHHS
jgi:O-antigen/teichoic acid export membrane protein